jgi:hypothetical protein
LSGEIEITTLDGHATITSAETQTGAVFRLCGKASRCYAAANMVTPMCHAAVETLASRLTAKELLRELDPISNKKAGNCRLSHFHHKNQWQAPT